MKTPYLHLLSVSLRLLSFFAAPSSPFRCNRPVSELQLEEHPFLHPGATACSQPAQVRRLSFNEQGTNKITTLRPQPEAALLGPAGRCGRSALGSFGVSTPTLDLGAFRLRLASRGATRGLGPTPGIPEGHLCWGRVGPFVFSSSCEVELRCHMTCGQGAVRSAAAPRGHRSSPRYTISTAWAPES